MSLGSPTVIKNVRKDFSRSLEMTTTVISNKVRDLSFPDFRRSTRRLERFVMQLPALRTTFVDVGQRAKISDGRGS